MRGLVPEAEHPPRVIFDDGTGTVSSDLSLHPRKCRRRLALPMVKSSTPRGDGKRWGAKDTRQTRETVRGRSPERNGWRPSAEKVGAPLTATAGKPIATNDSSTESR